MKLYSRETLAKNKPKVAFPRGFRLSDLVREMRDERNGNGGRIYEFVGTDNFGSEWNERRTYEVNAGREEEPILYTPIYDEIADANLPKTVNTHKIGPGGVVFEEVFEGGEVKFSSVTSSEVTVPIRHWATGLEYSKDLVVFNELWNVPIIERQVGVAYNALLNHLHLSPILTATYAAANQTAFNSGGSTTVEDFMLTIEDGITNSKADTTNRRRGPYVLIINPAQQSVVEKALTPEVQQGLAGQSSRMIDSIRSVITYDGWTGTRGRKATTYAGVTSGKGYLVSLQYRGMDFQSYRKQGLDQSMEETDITRFLTQLVWDSYWGVYANPIAAVEEISFS